MCDILQRLEADSNSSSSRFETLILAMGKAAAMLAGQQRLAMIMGLLTMLVRQDLRLHALALSQLEAAASHNRVSLPRFLEPYMMDLSRNLVLTLEHDVLKAEYIQRLFQTATAKDFFQQTLGYTLPYLVMKRLDVPLQRLAHLVNKDVPYLLADNAAKTFARVFTECPVNDMERALEFLSGVLSFYNISIAMLVKTDTQRILYDIVMDADLDRSTEARSRFVQGLRILAYYAEADTGSSAAPAAGEGTAEGGEGALSAAGAAAAAVAAAAAAAAGSGSSKTRPGSAIPANDDEAPSGTAAGASSGAVTQITATEAQLHRFLHGHMIAIIFYLKNQIMSQNDSFRRRALQGLMGICRVAGAQNVALVRVQIFHILAHTLKIPDLAAVSLDVLYYFVRHVDAAVLPSILPQVAVTLLPHFRLHAAAAAKILRFLIVENRIQLRHLFKDIFFLPQVPELEDVNSVLHEELQSLQRAGTPQLPERLQDLVKGLLHDSIDVRVVVLEKLRKTLADEHDRLRHLLLQEGASDEVSTQALVASLVNALLQNCCVSDANVRRLCGQCLGLIGAVDPGRVGGGMGGADSGSSSLSTTRSVTALPSVAGLGGRSEHQMFYSVHDPNLGVQLIGNYLVRALLSATTDRHQDHAAIALQECLKLFGCRPELEVTAPPLPADNDQLLMLGVGDIIWRRLPPEVRELVHPYLRSHYIWGKDRWKERPTHRRQSFSPDRGIHAWLHHWTHELIWCLVPREGARGTQAAAAAGATLDDERLFKACHGVMSDSIGVAFFLLPYLVLKVLLNASDDTQAADVHTELLLVLSAACNGAATNAGSTASTAATTPTTTASASKAQEALQLGVEAVFAILDYLRQWCAEQRQLRVLRQR